MMYGQETVALKKVRSRVRFLVKSFSLYMYSKFHFTHVNVIDFIVFCLNLSMLLGLNNMGHCVSLDHHHHHDQPEGGEESHGHACASGHFPYGTHTLEFVYLSNNFDYGKSIQD